MIAADLECGQNVVIGEGVRIGEGCMFGSNVVIHSGTVIGRNVQIGDNSVVGKRALRSRHSAITKADPVAPCVVGDDCLIGALVVLFRGCRLGEAVMVADQASVREQVTVGAGTIIGRGVAVENKVTIGERCKIETGAYVTALSTIGDYCFIAPEVTFTNDQFVARTKERFLYHRGVTMERGARIGANATILPGVTLGEDCLVAAASVVTRDVAPQVIVLGSPARFLRRVPAAQLLENQ